MDSGFNLEGKVAIITGGSRGIGRATALAFAEEKSKVAVASRKLPDLKAVVKEINALGGEGLAVVAHMGKSEDIRNLVDQTVNHFGRIDILVNNAASNPAIGPSEDMEERTWDHVMNVNLKGVFLLTQLVGRLMIKQGGGKIINISSTGGIKPGQNGLLAYNVSKGGIIMMTKALAQEWGKYNIRVNVVAPGLVETHLAEALYNDEEYGKRVLQSVSMGRLGQPDEIASVILFLASQASNYMNGATVVVDGGRIYH